VSALWVRSAWLVICGDGDEAPAARNPHPTKLPPLGEGWGGGFRTSSWPVARGLWRHRNTSFYALVMRSTCIPHPTSHTLFTTYYVLRTTHYVQFTHPTSHTLPPTSHPTTPLRPAATSPSGGGKRGSRLVACGPWPVVRVISSYGRTHVSVL